MLTLYFILVHTRRRSAAPVKRKLPFRPPLACSSDDEDSSPATSVKRKPRSGSPPDEIIRRAEKPVQRLVYSDDGEDAADTPKPKAASDIIRSICVVKSRQNPHVTAASIEDALRVGERYDIIDIQEINTCFGPKQVWSLKGVEDTSLKKVFGCPELQQFTTDIEGYLDRQDRRAMIDNVRVTYKGVLESRNGTYPKYDFDYQQRE